jgi:hypothetical protein
MTARLFTIAVGPAARVAACLVALSLPTSLWSQDTTGATAPATARAALYEERPYGSQSLYSPVSVLLNKGFDHFQARNARRDVWTFPYGATFRGAIWEAVRRPRTVIERHPGWSSWLRSEVLPGTFNTRDAGWVVNYTEHLIAGGLTYRMLESWYAHRRFPAPKLFAATTTMAAAVLNEAAEFAGAERASASSVADLWIFDLGGILLFSFEPLTNLFGSTLRATDWSNQATFTSDGALRNNGQYFVYKVPLPRDRWRLFLRAGMGAQVGLTRERTDGLAVTVALGGDTEVRLVDSQTGAESIRLRPGGGVYVDRHNSLLASITAGPAVQRYTVNIYPGVLTGRWRDLGLWAALTHDGHPTWGVVHRRMLGTGIGYARRH